MPQPLEARLRRGPVVIHIVLTAAEWGRSVERPAERIAARA